MKPPIKKQRKPLGLFEVIQTRAAQVRAVDEDDAIQRAEAGKVKWGPGTVETAYATEE
jgi:hypothetical protein